jgi:hypothetical protein
MRDIVKAFRRPPAVRPRDRNGGFPRLSDGVPHGLRCLASPRHALLAESLGKPSLWVIINAPWYKAESVMTEIIGPAQIGLVHTPNAKPGTAYGPALAAILSEAGFEAARREIAALFELDLPYLNSTSPT